MAAAGGLNLDEAAPAASRRSEQVVSPRLLVVIPTLDEADRIRQVLERLLVDLPRNYETTLVVADGGSTDQTTAVVKAIAAENPAVHLISNPARLQSSAVNLAARTFGRQADVLIRCDAHSLYPARFCELLLLTLERVEADSVVVAMDTIGHTCLQRAVAFASNSRIGNGGSRHRGGGSSGFVDHGHHAAFRMASFRAAGGYDETFSHNEDAELDCRQRALGARIYLASDIRLGYLPRCTFGALWRQYLLYGLGRSRTVQRHPASMRLRQLVVPLHVAGSFLAFALCHWIPALLIWPVLYVNILGVASLSLAIRHKSLAGLLVGPASAVMHAAWGCGFIAGMVAYREATWGRQMTVPLWDSSQPVDDE